MFSVSNRDECNVEAVKEYYLRSVGGRWQVRRCVYRISKLPFADGGFRVCHKAWKEGEEEGRTYVIKYFKKASHASRYFDEALGQVLSVDLCRKFRARARGVQVSFLPICIVEFEDGRNAFVERFLDGEFQKYNNNHGYVQKTNPIPQAFSHFTWTWSKGKLLICDIQGTESEWTDPQIHTIDGDGFGCGNRGLKGMYDFFNTHQCNEWCEKLKLSPSDKLEVLDMLEHERKSLSLKHKLSNASDCAFSPRSSHKPLMLYLLKSAKSESQMVTNNPLSGNPGLPNDGIRTEQNKDALFPRIRVHNLNIPDDAERKKSSSKVSLKLSNVFEVAVKLIRTLSPRSSDQHYSSPRPGDMTEKEGKQHQRLLGYQKKS